jgi:hypothetical protein
MLQVNQLIGFGVGGGGGAAGITFVASATTTTDSITIPASAAVGDLAVHIMRADTLVSGGDPSGFTLIDGQASANAAHGANYKILVGGDPGSTLTGLLNGTTEDSILLVFRGFTGTATPNTWTWPAPNNNNPSVQTVTASGETDPLIVFGSCGANTGPAVFVTASPAFDGEVVTSSGRLRVGYKIYNTSPANHSIDQNDLGNGNTLGSGFIKFV